MDRETCFFLGGGGGRKVGGTRKIFVQKKLIAILVGQEMLVRQEKLVDKTGKMGGGDKRNDGQKI